MSRLFRLGQTVITRKSQSTLAPGDVLRALARHESGDWGDVCPDDRAANEQAFANGERLLSVYRSGELTFWIITEHNRSATTILLPEEY